MDDLLVSVIIPTYSRPKNICRAIDSVLGQSYSNIEIIVVDDNGFGTEYQIATHQQLKSYIDDGKINYLIHQVNKNGSAARNTGFRASRGEFVAFLDDDDVFMSEKIERQVACLKTCDCQYGACYCNTRYLTETGAYGMTKYVEDGNLIRDYLLLKMVMNTSSILFRREVIEELDGFDESYVRHQDFEMMTRFYEKRLIKCCAGEPLLFLDWSGVRTNQPNIDKLIDVEEKFYNQFEQVLKENDLWEDIHHLWYFNIFMKCLKQHRIKKAYEFLRKSYMYMPFSKYQLKVIVINHFKLLFGIDFEA